MTKKPQILLSVRSNAILMILALCWAVPTWFAGGIGRSFGVVSAAVFLLLWFVRLKPVRRGALVFLTSVALGVLYIIATILAASRGISLQVSDAVLPFAATLVAQLIFAQQKKPLFAGLAVGLLSSVFWIHQVLPDKPALAGLDAPHKGATLNIKWHQNGMTATLVNPLDPPVEYFNNRARTWTVEQRWQAQIEADKKTLKNAPARGQSCLELQKNWGEDRLVEVISWIKDTKQMPLELKCPIARRSKINRKLKMRMSSRKEELAVAEALTSANTNAAIARARLAIAIYNNSSYARAVLSGCLLRRGIARLRTGKNTQAETDFKEALLYLVDPADQTRAHIAMSILKRRINH